MKGEQRHRKGTVGFKQTKFTIETLTSSGIPTESTLSASFARHISRGGHLRQAHGERTSSPFESMKLMGQTRKETVGYDGHV